MPVEANQVLSGVRKHLCRRTVRRLPAPLGANVPDPTKRMGVLGGTRRQGEGFVGGDHLNYAGLVDDDGMLESNVRQCRRTDFSRRRRKGL
jgi:hypothetical protein